MNPEFTPEGPFRSWAKNRTLGALADAIQPALGALLEGDDGARRPIKDLLHGTFLGHPLHPLLTDIPIGAWSVAAVCDTLELAGVERYRDAADVAIAIGALGAVGAAVTGLADWSDTKDEPQRLGMLHALLNSAALTSYLAALIARRAGARRLGLVTAFVGYGLVALAGYVGGELAFGLQLGVKHTVIPVDPPHDFVHVLDATDLTDGVMHAAQAGELPVLVTRFDGTTRAVSGVCTHRGAPLAEGKQDGHCVRCPWHGSRFSLDDGHIEEGPATFPLADYETQVAAGGVSVRIR
jgi:nitrite reductase/ring-hydroxylating ferredoxin subunit/uncharacterized membrane protein